MEEYQEKLKGKGIIQSMSRKATCLDNAVAENFFSLLKMELIYIQDFKTIENLADGIGAYIQYYNEKRIKLRLNSEMQDNAGYNDSLIGDAYADEGDAATEWRFSYHYAVRVPKLLSDSEDAKALNAELMALYGSEAMRPPESDSIKYAIGWESHWDGSLLSLEMTAVQPDGETHHDIYYFDFAAGKRLSGEDVLVRMELLREKLEPAFLCAAVREHDSMMQAQDMEFISGLIADTLALRAQSTLAAQDAALPFYPNGDGTPTVYLNLASYAGAGWIQQACIVDPKEQAVPLSASYEFITAGIDAAGTVTVEYHEAGDTFSGVDYQRIHGFAFDTPYTVRGCFGAYTDMFIGNIGSDFGPYLFLLAENGTLEYVDLSRCARYDTELQLGCI